MARKIIKIVKIECDNNSVDAKECTRCGVIKPLTEFHKSSDGSAGGRQSRCKVCKSGIFKEGYTPSDNITKIVIIKVNGVETQSKCCTSCKEVKPLSDYHFDKLGVGDRKTKCKECQNKMSEDWKSRNKDKLKQYEIKRWHENKNAESERKRKYYSKEKSSKRWGKWYTENLDKVKVNHINRVAKKKKLPNTLTSEELNKILDFFDNKCALTGSSADVQLDHFIAIDTGHGGTTKENIIPLSKELNISKKNINPFEWVKRKHIQAKINQKKFDKLIDYLSKINLMTVSEYKDYVYNCYENKRKNKTSNLIYNATISENK